MYTVIEKNIFPRAKIFTYTHTHEYSHTYSQYSHIFTHIYTHIGNILLQHHTLNVHISPKIYKQNHEIINALSVLKNYFVSLDKTPRTFPQVIKYSSPV